MAASIKYTVLSGVRNDARSLYTSILSLLEELRDVGFEEIRSGDLGDLEVPLILSEFTSFNNFIRSLCASLEDIGKARESESLKHATSLVFSDRELGGLGLGAVDSLDGYIPVTGSFDDILFLVEAWLRALTSAENSHNLPKPVAAGTVGRRPMTVSEKILAHHAFHISSSRGVKPGDFIRVSIDWVIASELSWIGMKRSLEKIGREPTVWRNDRFWLAGDHVVDPRTYHDPGVRELVQEMAAAKRSFKMTDNQGPNFTIMHTQFVRERAEPGMLLVGSDSHTCSAGAVGCLAVGLGAADVMMALATGETWFKVPEILHIRLLNKPAWYIKGKDVILYILKELKRNTFAADRIVEFSGPGAQYLSCDARFAICNMCTELGGITGIFAPDQVTYAYVNQRMRKTNKTNSIYFRADEGAQYAMTFEIDLAEVQSFLALYPSPDNVVPIKEKLDMRFDGCFIGACTTTEEELILAALVLKVGLEENLPLAPGKRKVVPGSLPIVNRLRKLGLLDVYEQAGFVRTAPGCSMCIAMGADKAGVGETWLSSQNRNFKNRMGKGSFGNICSAATVAASSFSMTLTDPDAFLEKINQSSYEMLLGGVHANANEAPSSIGEAASPTPTFVEPFLAYTAVGSDVIPNGDPEPQEDRMADIVGGKIYALGDFVDTDAIIPADKILASPTEEQLGDHCLEYTNPDFRDMVRSGHCIVVAGNAFGCGSSREEAPRALKGLGVKCVIARSFSFIYGRNQPTIALLGFIIEDDRFYEQATTGVDISIDVTNRVVTVAGKHQYPFKLDEMELALIRQQGLAQGFLEHGRHVFQVLCGEHATEAPVQQPEAWGERMEQMQRESRAAQLAW